MTKAQRRVMKRHASFIIALLLPTIFTSTCPAEAYPGVPTRSQNPLLQGYFIPAMPITGRDKWSFSNALYITNTYQTESNANEDLVIDVENTRYDFQATYRHQLWHFNINLSLIQNDKGYLDQTIENWHDFFGLPQGGRDTAANNRINLFYEHDGIRVIDSQQAESGLGDIQLTAGYQLTEHSQLWFGIEVSSSDRKLFSNDDIDLALWYATQSRYTDNLQVYGLVGLGLPADSGAFERRLEDQFMFAQLGMAYQYRPAWVFFLQSDLHSRLVKGSQLDAFDHSFQAQFGLRLPKLMERHQLELFFSEDLFPGHAPDISFAIRLSPNFD